MGDNTFIHRTTFWIVPPSDLFLIHKDNDISRMLITYSYPTQLASPDSDARKLMHLIRERSAKWNIEYETDDLDRSIAFYYDETLLTFRSSIAKVWTVPSRHEEDIVTVINHWYLCHNNWLVVCLRLHEEFSFQIIYLKYEVDGRVNKMFLSDHLDASSEDWLFSSSVDVTSEWS